MKAFAGIFTVLALVLNAVTLAEDTGDAVKKIETRKKEYENLQKEMEVTRPGNDATKEEILAYLEHAKERYGEFAKSNGKTPEGFEAAFSIASLLAQAQHPDSAKYSQLAIDAAPAAGVEMKKVAICWAFVAQGKLLEQDAAGARAAVDKIKTIDMTMHAQLTAQLDELEKTVKQQQEAAERLKPGGRPLPIEGRDLEGNEVSLDTLKGKVVLVDFWASWCGPCMNEVPEVVKIYKANHEKGLEIIGISLDREAQALKNAVRRNEMTWPIIFDSQSALARSWAIQEIPQTYVIDRKGFIRHCGLRGTELAAAIEKLVGEP